LALKVEFTEGVVMLFEACGRVLDVFWVVDQAGVGGVFEFHR
jgi:hypothetical protein